MADLALKPEIASEFVRFLDAQLKEARQQLQRSTDVSDRFKFLSKSDRACFYVDAASANHNLN